MLNWVLSTEVVGMKRVLRMERVAVPSSNDPNADSFFHWAQFCSNR